MTSFATVSDLAKAIVPVQVPANATQLITAAGRMVADAVRLAVFDVDVDGNATSQVVIDALRDATVAQAAAWAALNIDPSAGGVVTAGGVASKSLDGTAVAYSGAKEAATARASAVTSLVPEAERILRLAGLTSTTTWVFG